MVRLAIFRPVAEILDDLRERWGIEISPQGIYYYVERGTETWGALFETTRSAYLREVGEVPIANQRVRLEPLDRMAQKLEDAGDRGSMAAVSAKILEQAAKDVGGVFTREATAAGGAPSSETVRAKDLLASLRREPAEA